MHLNVFVSQKCFLYCKGCYSFSRTEKYGQIVDTYSLVKFLEYAYRKGINNITLCGGDPLVRKDILDLLKKIKEIGYYISMDTVGTSLIRDVINIDGTIIKKIDASELVSYVDKIGLPIDGSNNEIFRKFRLTNFDILSDQLKIYEELSKNNANICINTVVHKGNLEDAESLSKIINTLDKIEKWQLFKYAPMGKYGIINRNLFEITEEEFERYRGKIISSCSRKNILEFKGYSSRNRAYMLVDNSGNAWIPEYNQNLFNDCNRTIENRDIIGNITNVDDWKSICKKLKMGG